MSVQKRKEEHLRICLEEDVEGLSGRSGFERYRFLHNALPDIDLAQVSLELCLWGRKLRGPVLISSMTGGTPQASRINQVLAEVAQELGLAMGVGSQRAGLLDASLAQSYQVRSRAPDILLFANMGAIQLNHGWGVDECRRAVHMLEADALILHINALQEVLQPEGDTRWSGLTARIAEVCGRLERDRIPVIVKEVGCGISPEVARRLWNAGVAAIDVAGAGGTSWSRVEAHRALTELERAVAESFADWGIPTAESLRSVVEQGVPEGRHVFACGGIRNGIDVAKAIALGASLVGMARRFLEAAVGSREATLHLAQRTLQELRVAMFALGMGDLAQLRGSCRTCLTLASADGFQPLGHE